MRKEQNKNIQKNKKLNNSIKDSSFINIEEVNKAIELTRFNVSFFQTLFFIYK